jgi:hypothetical protein
MQAWGSGAGMPPPNFAVPNVAFAEPYAHIAQPQQNVAIIGGYNKMWPSLEDTLQETCKISQSYKPMQTKWVKEMQTSPMSLDTFS